MQKLLEAQNYERLELLTPPQYESAVDDGESWDVVVFLDWTPDELAPGRYLIFKSTSGLDPLEPFGTAEKVFVRSAQDEHPAFRFVILDDLFVWEMSKVVAGDEATVLTDAVEGPMIVEIDQGGVQALWVAFHPLDSTWWRQRSFAIFVPNAIEYLAAIGGAVVEKGLLPGEVVSMLLPPGASNAVVTHPDETAEEALITPEGMLVWGPVRRAGLYGLSWTMPDGSTGTSEVAVNMLDSEEGRVDVREAIDFSVERVAGERVIATSRASIWPWLLGIGLFVLLLEWYVYFRKAA